MNSSGHPRVMIYVNPSALHSSLWQSHKKSIAPNAKSGHFTNLLNFVWAKVTIMNCNIQQTTLLTSSGKNMGLCGVFSKLSSNVNMAGSQ